MRDYYITPEDIRDRTKEDAIARLFRAELTYLISRGWDTLCGTSDMRCMVKPDEGQKISEAQKYTHEEALAIQKEVDK